MINNVTLVGRLTADPLLKYTNTGVAITTFTLAVDDPFTKGKTDFLHIVCWRGLAETVANYTKKGSLVGLTGRISTRSYDNHEGKKTWVTEIVADNVRFLDSKGEKRESRFDQDVFKDEGKPVDISDDDLPF